MSIAAIPAALPTAPVSTPKKVSVESIKGSTGSARRAASKSWSRPIIYVRPDSVNTVANYVGDNAELLSGWRTPVFFDICDQTQLVSVQFQRGMLSSQSVVKRHLERR